MKRAVAQPAAARRTKPVLRTGERMDQPTFHRLYEKTPKDFRAELVQGRVYVASPVPYQHGTFGLKLATLFKLYAMDTPGTHAALNVTVILDQANEPTPDSLLLIGVECGGQTSINEQGYLAGAPELIGEIARTSAEIDLGVKKDGYQLSGVVEYVVACTSPPAFHWFNLQSDQPLKPGPDGIHRSRFFPGLWIDSAALLREDMTKLVQVLKQGLASPEHARFVRRLQSRQRPSRG